MAQCSSTVQGQGSFTQAVTWNVNNITGGNSVVGTISAQGLYQAPDPIPSAAITISAVSQQDSTKQGSTNISLFYPQPAVGGVAPTNMLWMGSTTQVQVTGSNFSQASTILIGGVSVPTAYVSSSQLTANVPASALQTIGSLPVAVSTSGPGGGASSNLAIQVIGGTLAVTVNSLPSSATTAIQVTGPQSFITTLAASGTINGLAAGTYTITAATGSTSDSTFPPDQAVQSATIVSLAPIGISVNYNTGLYKSVKYLDTEGITSIAFVPGQHTFTVDPSSAIGAGLLAGDVLVIPDCTAVPGGAVVRVDSVSSASQIIVNFEAGNLGDVFSALDLNVTEEIGADQITNVQSQITGVNVVSHARTAEERANAQPHASSPCSGNPNTIEVTDSGDLTLSTTPPPPGSPPPTVTANAGLHVSASLQFCPTVTFQVQHHYAYLVVPVLDVASISAGMDIFADVSASTEAALTLSKTIPLAEYDAVKIPIPDTGGALYLTPKLTLLLGMDGSFNGKAAMGMSQEATGTVEVDYDDHTGTISSKNNTTVNPPTPDNPILEASASAKVSVGLKMELTLNAGLSFIDLSLASVGGYVEPRVYLEADADINQNPWWTLSAGLDALAGMDFSFLGDNKSFDSRAIPLFSKQILQSQGPFLKNVTLTGMYAAGPGSGVLTAASGPQTVNLIGSGFAPDMTVTTSFLTSRQSTIIPNPNILSATVDVLLNKSGLWKAQVLNTDGSVSPVLTVTVQPPLAQPTITALLPDFIQGSINNQQFTLSGQGFQDGLTVQLCKQVCYATLSGTQILSVTGYSISAQAVLNAGNWTAQVFNPDGGSSNIFPFIVQPAFSASISPGTGTVGVTSFAITGSGATPGQTVLRSRILPDKSTPTENLLADAKGAFSVTAFVPSIVGPYVETFTDVKTGIKTPGLSYIVSASNANYTISSSTPSIAVTAGNSGSFVLTATSTGGFAGTVALSTINLSSIVGANGSWSSPTIALTSGNHGTSTYSFSTSTSTPVGTYTLTIQTSSGSLTPSTSVTVVVSAPSQTPNYTISPSSSAQSINAGSSASFNLTATSTGGFAGTIYLTQPSLGISGASGYWSPSSISLSSGSQGASTLIITTSASTPSGTYSIPIQTSSGQLSQNTSVSLTINNSSQGLPTLTNISISPNSVASGAYATLSFTLSGPAPSGGATISLQTNNSGFPLPSSYTISSGQSSANFSAQTSTVLTQTTTTTVTATYNGGSKTASITVTAAVTAPTAHFTMTGQGQTFSDGGTLPLSITTGGSASANFTSTSTPGSAPITTYVWKSNGTQDCTNATTCGLTFTGAGSATITLTVTDQNGKMSTATGTVVVTVSNPTPTISLINPNTFTLNQGGGSVAATITGTGFTSQSYHQYSVSGGAQWAWATQPPTFNSSISMTIDVATSTAQTQYYRVCVSETGSAASATCSGSLTVTVTPAPAISSVTQNVPGSTTVLEPVTIRGTNFPTASNGGYLIFTDTIGNTYLSTAHPERIQSSSSTQWVYTIDDNNDAGTWKVQIFPASGQDSNIATFTVQ
jgi:hypothetical protein